MTKRNKRKVRPVKKMRTGHTKGGYYERKTACCNIGIHFIDDEDDFPAKVIVEPKGTGGCKAGIEALARLITMCFESNIAERYIVEELKKVLCKECRAGIKSGKKNMSLSCAHAVGTALEEHLQGKGLIENPQKTTEPLVEVVKSEEKK